MRARFTFLLILTWGALSAQHNIVLVKMGVGTFSMKTQKTFQKDFQEYSDLPLHVVHTFPPYLTFGGTVGFKTGERSAIGIWCEYASTGGRLHYKDYSGSARMDQLLTGFQVGIFCQFQINKSVDWPVFLTQHFSIMHSNASFTSELVIGSASEVEKLSLKSKEFGFRPGAMIQHKIKRIVFQGSIGYELQIHGGLESEGRQLYTADGDEVKAEWDGLRVGLEVGIPFQFHSKKGEIKP